MVGLAKLSNEEARDLVMAELGGILYPVEKGVRAGEFCYFRFHRPLSLLESAYWNFRKVLPKGCAIHSHPRRVYP